jgi:hypothetical protein
MPDNVISERVTRAVMRQSGQYRCGKTRGVELGKARIEPKEVYGRGIQKLGLFILNLAEEIKWSFGWAKS